MVKKLLTILMAAILLVSATTTALAAKKETSTETDPNIYSLWGDFEWSGSEKAAYTYTSKGAAVSRVQDGANGSSGAVKYDGINATAYDDLCFNFPAVYGETYEISFDAKVLTEGITKIHPIVYRDQGWNQFNLNAAPVGEWKNYKVTFNCTLNDSGVNGGNGKTFNIRPGGSYPCSIVVDNISIIPAGKVDADYSSVNNGVPVKKDKEEEEIHTYTPEIDTFSDVSGHWAETVIMSLARNNFVNGVGGGRFFPENNVTRAEFIKMFTGLYDANLLEYDGRFKDVNGDEWYADYLSLADSLGIIDVAMKAGGKIQPDKPITREEAASIAIYAAKERGAKINSSNVKSFADSGDISPWAKDYVKDASASGLIVGYENGEFRPQGSITRAEAAQLLMRVVEVSSRMNIYVDPEIGNDKNDGTMSAPLQTITEARDLAAKYAQNMDCDITIYIRGEHYLWETFRLDETHSGQNGHNIVYTSWGDDKAVLTMAKKYTGFELHDAEKNIWKAFIGQGTYSRQAYFNDVKGIRARTVGSLKNCELIDRSYYLCDNKELLDIKYPNEVDAVYHILWLNPRHLLDSVVEENGRVRINMSKYFNNNQHRLVMESTVSNHTGVPSYLENAYEFLNEQGEWYINKHDGYIYYIPRDGEDMSTMECKIPIGEEMIVAQGSSYQKPLHNVVFDNLVFEGTSWLRPDRVGGYVSVQNNYIAGTRWSYTDDGVEAASPGSALHFEKCNNIILSNNLFRQMGIGGVEFVDGSKHIDIVGNEFTDISSSAILIDEASDTGYPANRSEDSYVEYVNVSNNYIHHVATDYKGAGAVSFVWPRHTNFTHNEICYTPYSGMHIGWGWSEYETTGSITYDFEIDSNYIHDVMLDRLNDGAAIYTVSKTSFENDMTPDAPNNGANKNRIINNYITNGWNCDLVYLDQESSSYYVANNVADLGPYRREMEYNFDREPSTKKDDYWMKLWKNTIKWITTENNYSTHDYAYAADKMKQVESSIEPVKIYADRNWPAEALEIINNAGIEPEYRDNFNLSGGKVFVSNDRWQKLEVGKPQDSGLMVLGEYNTKFPLENYDVQWWCEDPEAVTFDKNGQITAHKEGTFECEAFCVVDGAVMSQHFMLECFSEIQKITVGEKIDGTAGWPQVLPIVGTTSTGEEIDMSDLPLLQGVNLESDDESIATFGFDEEKNKYIVTLNTIGETRLRGNIIYDGESYHIDVPVKVSGYGSDEAETLPFTVVDFTSGWNQFKTGKSGNGFVVDISGSHNTDNYVDNQLVAFDMVIEPGTSWPSIAFCDKGEVGTYSTDDCYMFGFKSTFIELQKWNSGKRTMIYGEEKHSPVEGLGYPNTDENKVFEYGKRYSIVMGAIEENGTTRVVLNINGENIIDYIDDTENQIEPNGYFVSYNTAPGTTFYPYSGITND